MANVANIAIEKTTFSFDKPFSYYIPENMQAFLKPGCRVIVPFGGGNRIRQGLVLSFGVSDLKGLKEISSIIDPSPILNEEMLFLVETIRKLCFCTYYEVIKAIIPTGISVKVQELCCLDKKIKPPESITPIQEQLIKQLSTRKKAVHIEKLLDEVKITRNNPDFLDLVSSGVIILSEAASQKVGDNQMNMAKLAPAFEDGTITLSKRTSKQKAVIDILLENGCASLKELLYYAGVGLSVIKNLVKMGVIEEYGRQIFRSPYIDKELPLNTQPLELTPSQQIAYESLLANLQTAEHPISLLHGVTGSGKTRVFLKLIEFVNSSEKGVIVLVPEISLTPQTVEVFRRRFGKQVALLHSGLSMGERADEFRRIQKKEANLVIGTRSAIFAPLPNIGLIVIDEEQEDTYKSGKTPTYHAREIAKIRCRYHKAMLLLASATPSIESFYYAQKGKYQLVTLSERFHGHELPEVSIVDISDSFGTDISRDLAVQITDNIHSKQQTILLINRRGYNTIVKCQTCGEVASCPNCSVALTYHHSNARLMCHYCGYSQNIVDHCPKCSSDLMRYGGTGTQKIEELLETAFPEARILRMDMDTTMARFAHEKKFAAFAAGEYDIMVGTQMVAKGLNFPNVTLVGVLNADQSLYAQDFRGMEKTFSLITQVVGRCGRGDLQGRALIQTYTPYHSVIKQAALQDYNSFYSDEIKSRNLGLYPPFCDICVVGFSGSNQKSVEKAAKDFSLKFRDTAREGYSELPLRMLEPCEPPVERISGRFRFQLLVKYRQSNRFLELMWNVLSFFYSNIKNKDIHVFADLYYSGSI